VGHTDCQFLTMGRREISPLRAPVQRAEHRLRKYETLSTTGVEVRRDMQTVWAGMTELGRFVL
jgi:hypothetical protein